MISKKTLLIVSGIGTVVLLIANYVGTAQLCGGGQYTICMGNLYAVMMNFFPVIPLLLFSLITYWMREEIYQAWFRFARWWVPLSMLLILISPEYSSDWMYPVVKGTVAFLTSMIFAAVSSLIILIKHLRRSR